MTYTTIDVDDLKSVKQEALKRDMTLREFVNHSIKMYLGGSAVEIEDPERAKAGATKRNMMLEEFVNRAIEKYLQEVPCPASPKDREVPEKEAVP
ncbi:hypothetical protein ES706_05754 [subsurface metagenome]